MKTGVKTTQQAAPTERQAMLTTADVARQLSCSRRMVQKLVQLRELPARRLGRLLRFEPADVQAYRDRLPVVGVAVDRRRLRSVTESQA